jgi:hypothetical protein
MKKFSNRILQYIENFKRSFVLTTTHSYVKECFKTNLTNIIILKIYFKNYFKNNNFSSKTTQIP